MSRLLGSNMLQSKNKHKSSTHIWPNWNQAIRKPEIARIQNIHLHIQATVSYCFMNQSCHFSIVLMFQDIYRSNAALRTPSRGRTRYLPPALASPSPTRSRKPSTRNCLKAVTWVESGPMIGWLTSGNPSVICRSPGCKRIIENLKDLKAAMCAKLHSWNGGTGPGTQVLLWK